MKPIKLHWWRAPKGNFGDDLSPILVERLSRRRVVHAEVKDCDVVAVGSLLDRMTKRRWQRILKRPLHRAYVWGTGSFGEASGVYHHLEVTAVRGPKTRELLRLPSSTPVGDPALLLPKVVKSAPKKHRYGIVPHMHHQQHPVVEELAKIPGAKVIDLTNTDTLGIAREISSCDFIVSSSLHGLITADAYAVPNIWLLPPSDMGEWKFHDYFESVGRRVGFVSDPLSGPQIEKLATAAEVGKVDQLVSDIAAAFPYQ